MLTDVEQECKNNNLSEPTDQQIVQLHNTLSELSANAVEDFRDDDDPSGQLNGGSFSDAPRSVWSSDDTPELSSGNVTTSSSDVSNVNFPQFAFLQAAFPHIESTKLRAAIVAVGGPDGSADMEDVVEEVLKCEYLRECQERGIDVDTLLDDLPKSKPIERVAPAKKKGMKLVINDIRQQHQLSSPNGFNVSPPNPWAQSVSLSTFLETLIPSCNANHFQSAFHNPQHSSPCEALRHTLQKINDRLYPANDELSKQETQYLFGMFDALRATPAYETMNVVQRDQLLSDARLALRATGGNPDLAWELVSKLLELGRDLDVGIYHSPPATPSSPTFVSPTSPIHKFQPSTSQWATSGSTTSPPINPTPKDNDLDGGWNYIPERPRNRSHSLAASIPALDPNRKARVRGSGNGFGKGAKGDVGELDSMQRIARLHKSRNQILREATRYWKGGNVGNRGGEVAQYFAQRVSCLRFVYEHATTLIARCFPLRLRREMLRFRRKRKNCRSFVIWFTGQGYSPLQSLSVTAEEASRKNTDGYTSIDLHGATLAEASQIVQDILYDTPPTNSEGPSFPLLWCRLNLFKSTAKPLRIITGRGRHSANRVGVLRPALKNRLTDLGWDVALFDGGLVVRG